MVSFTLTTLTAVFAALTTALPATNQKRASEFSLVLHSASLPTSGSPIVAAHDSAAEFTLITGSGSILDGTPVKLLDSNYVVFQIGSSEVLPYGMTTADVGDAYGDHVPVTATPGNGTGGFSISEGYLRPKLTSGGAAWFACNTTVALESVVALEFGVRNTNGTAPWGCEAASVQVYTRG